MFFSKFYLFALLGGVFLLSGCASTEPVRLPRPDKKEQLRQEQKAAALAEKITAFAIRGTVLDRSTLLLREPELLVERLKHLGFNRVFFHLSPEEEIDETIAVFNALCRRAGVDVYACFRQSDAVYKPAAGAFWRKCTAKEVTLAAVAAEFAEKNRELPEEQQFKGVVLVMTPHLFTPSVPFRPANCPYAWDSKRFGAGLDNEALMNYSIREVENAAAAVAPLPVMVQIPDFYYNWVKSGKLPAGTLLKFSTSGNGKARELVLLNSGNKPSELFSKVEAGLKSTPAAVPVLVAVNLAPHTAVTKGELRRRNWGDLVRSIRYAAGRYRGSRDISGVILGPYSRLEILLEEK